MVSITMDHDGALLSAKRLSLMHKLQNIMAFYLSYHVQQGFIMSPEHSTLLWDFFGSHKLWDNSATPQMSCETRNSNFILYDPIINT